MYIGRIIGIKNDNIHFLVVDIENTYTGFSNIYYFSQNSFQMMYIGIVSLSAKIVILYRQ